MIDKKLCKDVEQTLGFKLQTSADFTTLANMISRKIGENVSPTTLKRVWGYLSEEVTPRLRTFDLLAQFVGYRDYSSFCSGSGAQQQSNMVMGRKLSSDDLKPDQELCLTWLPDRKCVVRYGGNGRFRVIEAINTKLSVGDTFTCHLMIEHEPLFVDKLIHNGKGPFSFVAGRCDGIMFQLVDRNK